MKNIHVLPTDKPSRLFIYNGDLGFAKGFQYGSDAILNQQIYITSDKETTKCGVFWHYNNIFNIVSKEESAGYKKIILTTDQDLIKDGVQAIDDDFLEWFVKNPSCEEVEVNESPITNEPKGCKSFYKIIIPKEELKQETLEEAVKKEYNDNLFDYEKYRYGFIEGAKWQAERMYSEEELLDALKDYDREFKIDTFSYTKPCSFTIEEWFEKFKKK